MSVYSVSLPGPGPWGFRLQGGKDFNTPLTIARLNDSGKAAQANIGIGDKVLTIDGIRAEGITHLDAQNMIRACTGSLNMTLQKASTAANAPQKEEPPKEVFKPVPVVPPASTVPKITSTTSVAYNKVPRPFGAVSSTKVTSIPSPSSAFTAATSTSLRASPQPSAFTAATSTSLRASPQPSAFTAATSTSTSLRASPQPSAFTAATSSSTSLRASPQPSAISTFTTPTSTSASLRASPQPSALSLLGAGTSPATPGVHASAKPRTDGTSPALGAPKTSVNIPWQPATYSATKLYSSENAQEASERQQQGLKENQGDRQPNGPPRKHIVDMHTDFYHAPTHSEDSKKRLMDDTEDWHPRTGTTQSRSFRILAQITGTENLAEAEPENAKKTNDSLESPNSGVYAAASARNMPTGPEKANRPAISQPAVAHPASTSSAKPSGHTGAVKSTGWQPISQAVPTSGKTPNAAPYAATAPSSRKPVVQPPLMDQDTLVQKAEHIPAGTRTPMCAHCNLVIRGPFLLALGKSWHPEEFNCAHCKKSMAESGFVVEQGSLYCDLCYGKFFAPECSRCHKKILGEVINALKQTWHVTCFVCVACSQPIRNNTFHLEDGDPYCETDYYSLFGTMCRGCEFPIEAGDRFLEALGSTWHDTCFVCAVCCDSLEGQTFFSKKDKPLCKKHAHSVNM